MFTLNKRTRRRNTARPGRIPAPIRGMVTEKPVSAMRQDEALVLANCVPRPSGIEVRGGMERLVNYSAITTDVKRNGNLHFYTTTAVRQIYADCEAGIRSYNTGALVQADAHTALSRPYVSQQFTTAGGTYLYMLRPGQTPFLWNGAAWVAITGASVPAITGVVTTTLEYIFAFKRRLWFIQTGTQNLWYLPVDSIGGAAVAFPIGPLLTRGGSPLVLFSWSGPQGDGIDDYFCILTTEGELIVYQGTDPAAAATWALVGVFFVGRPLEFNVSCFVKMGGDTLIMTNAGIFSIGSILNGKQAVRENSLTAPIHTLYQMMSSMTDKRYHDLSVGPNSLKLFYSQNESLLIVAMISSFTDNIHLVYSSQTKGWCYWTKINITTGYFDAQEDVLANGSSTRSTLCADYVVYEDPAYLQVLVDIYCRMGNSVQRDAVNTEQTIEAFIVPAPQNFGSLQKKTLKLIRPIFSPGGAFPTFQTYGEIPTGVSMEINFSADFAPAVSEIDANFDGLVEPLRSPSAEATARHTDWYGRINASVTNTLLNMQFVGNTLEIQPRALFTYQWRDIVADSGSTYLLVIRHNILAVGAFPGWVFDGMDILYEPSENYL